VIGRIDPLFGMLDDQVGMYSIAFVPQEQRLAPVGDQDQTIVP